MNCPIECQTNFANPFVKTNCPSSCADYDDYSTLNTMYNTYIPPAEKARLIASPSVVADYQVANPRIVTFSGQVQSAQEQATPEARLIEGFRYIAKQPKAYMAKRK